MNTEPPGEQSVTVGVVDQTPPRSACPAKRTRHNLGPNIHVSSGVRNERRPPARPRRPVHTDDVVNRHGPKPTRIVVPQITLSDHRQPRKIVNPDVQAPLDPSVPKPPSLQPTRGQQPVNQLPQPPFLQLTPPERINPLGVRLDKGHHLSISDHASGCSTTTIPKGRTTRLHTAHGRRVTCTAQRGCSAAGSAPHWQCGGQGFEPPQLHNQIFIRNVRRPAKMWSAGNFACPSVVDRGT